MAELTPGMQMTRTFEGYKPHVYVDSEGYYTSGAGHKLTKEELSKYNLPKIAPEEMYGQDLPHLKVEGSDDTFLKDYGTAQSGAQRFFGDDWDSLSQEAKDIATDLTFNVGADGIKGFKNFKQAMIDEDYQSAAEELRYYNPDAAAPEIFTSGERKGQPMFGAPSKWWNQTGGKNYGTEDYEGESNRAVTLYNKLRDMGIGPVVNPGYQQAFTQ